ncbi:MAG: methyltransferase domain-containing protein [Candidatus Uhrbacteria bacterium]|nr:methyltransferase domain-containing protein [Candidatus Uhrbacteria bacterium]
MDRLFGRETVTSPRNGTIVIRRWCGVPGIFVDGFDQSTGYIRTMWHQALRHVPKRNVKRVLMLGLCAGVGVSVIRRRFRGAAITVIDWDPFMIEIFKKLNPQKLPITIIEGDAFVEMPKLTDTFDVIIVDLFKGKEPAPQLREDAYVQMIARVLAPDGRCIVNAFATPAVFDVFDRSFERQGQWKYRYNTYALYQKHAPKETK